MKKLIRTLLVAVIGITLALPVTAFADDTFRVRYAFSWGPSGPFIFLLSFYFALLSVQD